MSEDKKVSYLSTFFGGVGTILVLLGAVSLYKNGEYVWFYLVFFGLLLSVSYINNLESKAGVGKKVTWIRALLSMIIFFIVSYFIYF